MSEIKFVEWITTELLEGAIQAVFESPEFRRGSKAASTPLLTLFGSLPPDHALFQVKFDTAQLRPVKELAAEAKVRMDEIVEKKPELGLLRAALKGGS